MNYYTSNFNHPIPTSAPYHSSHNQIGISNDRDQDSNYDDDDELFKWEFGFRGSKFIVLLLALILRVAIGYFPYSGIILVIIGNNNGRSGKSSKIWRS